MMERFVAVVYCESLPWQWWGWDKATLLDWRMGFQYRRWSLGMRGFFDDED